MVVMFYFLGAALAVAAIFLMLDTQQSKRTNKVLRDTKGVQPLFLQRAAEQKLGALNALLYNNLSLNNTRKSDRVNLNGNARLMLSAQLSSLVNEHRNGMITLEVYSNGLNDLLRKAQGE